MPLRAGKNEDDVVGDYLRLNIFMASRTSARLEDGAPVEMVWKEKIQFAQIYLNLRNFLSNLMGIFFKRDWIYYGDVFSPKIIRLM